MVSILPVYSLQTSFLCSLSKAEWKITSEMLSESKEWKFCWPLGGKEEAFSLAFRWDSSSNKQSENVRAMRTGVMATPYFCLSSSANTLEVLSSILIREANLNLCTCSLIMKLSYLSQSSSISGILLEFLKTYFIIFSM